jgi:hypothetical protein
MACGCVGRQRWLVKVLCRAGMTKACQLAKARLERMERKELNKGSR